MTKTIKICDKCKREVKWLYDVPYLYIEGLTVAVRAEGIGVQELCKKCAKKLFDKFNYYSLTNEGGDNE